jgi:hypothetical protein
LFLVLVLRFASTLDVFPLDWCSCLWVSSSDPSLRRLTGWSDSCFWSRGCTCSRCIRVLGIARCFAMLRLADSDYRDWGIHCQSMVACEKQLTCALWELASRTSSTPFMISSTHGPAASSRRRCRCGAAAPCGGFTSWPNFPSHWLGVYRHEECGQNLLPSASMHREKLVVSHRRCRGRRTRSCREKGLAAMHSPLDLDVPSRPHHRAYVLDDPCIVPLDLLWFLCASSDRCGLEARGRRGRTILMINSSMSIARKSPAA